MTFSEFRILYETHISAFQEAPATAARLFEPEFHQERTGHSRQPPPRRAQAFDAGMTGAGGESAAGDALAKLGYGLPRERRLKTPGEFARLKRDGARSAKGCLIANWRRLPGPGESKLGVVTPKSVGRSVDRSRARRLLREVFRLRRNDFHNPVEMVLVARSSIKKLGFKEVERDFELALRGRAVLAPKPSV